jgi:hypothetical protein
MPPPTSEMNALRRAYATVEKVRLRSSWQGRQTHQEAHRGPHAC